MKINPLKVKLNPICHLLALLEAHPIFHVSRIRVKRIMEYCWKNTTRRIPKHGKKKSQ
jgi:hypothetical protein